jgi:hypothetical protein
MSNQSLKDFVLDNLEKDFSIAFQQEQFEEFQKQDYQQGGSQKAYFGAGYKSGKKFLDPKIKELEAQLKDTQDAAKDRRKIDLKNADKIIELEKKLELAEAEVIKRGENFNKVSERLAEADKKVTREVFKYSTMESIREANKNLGSRLNKAEEKLKVAVEALEFYGDAKNWRMSEMCSLVSDSILKDDIENSWRTSGGKRAREALKKISEGV